LKGTGSEHIAVLWEGKKKENKGESRTRGEVLWPQRRSSYSLGSVERAPE